MAEGGENAPTTLAPESLGASLAPVLKDQCGGKLGEIEWFRATWQRGGASTGFSTWSMPDASSLDVVVKVPVGPVEHRWSTLLGKVEAEEFGACGDLPTPRLLASGDTLGGYDLGWVVVERLRGHPLPINPEKREVQDLLATCAEVQARAVGLKPEIDAVRRRDWGELLDRSRHAIEGAEIPHTQRWNEAVKKSQKALGRLTAAWLGRPNNAWCHGDLHPGNAMRRDGGKCVLIDLALVHPGHWVEDALYLERQYWGHEDLLQGVKPVSALNKARKRLGLEPGEGLAEIADVRRVLMAACVPAFLNREGNPKYIEAALGVLERLLPKFL